VLAAEVVDTDILGIINPRLDTKPMRQVVLPIARVLASITMCVNAKAIRLVVLPISMIDVSVNMSKFSESARLAFLPLAFVLGTVRPNLLTIAVSERSLPFTLV